MTFSADLEVVAKPVVIPGADPEHQIQFECVMSNPDLGITTGDVVYDVAWHLTKSGRRHKVHQETTDRNMYLNQSVLSTI